MIDSYEMCAVQAMYNAKVKSKKRIKLADIYDADKARKEIDKVEGSKAQPLYLDRYRKALPVDKNLQAL